MTVFNIQRTLEEYLAKRVSTLFTVLSDDTPIKRAFDNSELMGSFVGSGIYSSQGDEPDITGDGDVIRLGAFESKKVVPRQMLLFNREALKTELLQEYITGLEYQRFVGGIGDEANSSNIISPFLDGVIKDNVQNNVVIDNDSFLNAYSKLNKVGSPYLVFNPNIEGASEEVKKFVELFPQTIVVAPKWLSTGAHMAGIKGFVTTTGAMSLGKFTDPVWSEEMDLQSNTVTLRWTGELFGAELFKNATAIIGTPVKPTT